MHRPYDIRKTSLRRKGYGSPVARFQHSVNMSKMTGRSLGWRAILSAAIQNFNKDDFAKAEELAHKALKSAEKYHGDDSIELIPILVLLIDIYDGQENCECALPISLRLREILHSMEPEAR